MWYKGQTSYLVYQYPIVLASFVEKTIFFIIEYICQKSIDHICTGICLFLDSLFCSIDYVCPWPILQCFDYCSISFRKSQEIRYFESSNTALIQNCFGYSKSFAFPYKFLKTFVNFLQKNPIDWHSIELLDTFQNKS